MAHGLVRRMVTLVSLRNAGALATMIPDDYHELHARYGVTNPKANGYRSLALFRREQAIVLERIDSDRHPILDIGCGTGLVLQPLISQSIAVVGLDLHGGACLAARSNGVRSIQGDAINMPFARSSIGQAVNCGFLNQLNPEQATAFIAEVARILMPGGRCIILWRHGKSLLHRVAHRAFRTLDRLFWGQPPFPQYTHSFAYIRQHARDQGLNIIEEAITLPPPAPITLPNTHPTTWLFGASLLIVLEKPNA